MSGLSPREYRVQNELLPCEVFGCDSPRRWTATHCAYHVSRLRMHGDTSRPSMDGAKLRSLEQLIRYRIKKIVATDDPLLTLTATRMRRLFDTVKRNRDHSDYLVRLVQSGVTPTDIICRITSVFAYAKWHDPDALTESKYMMAQCGRRLWLPVIKLRPSEKRSPRKSAAMVAALLTECGDLVTALVASIKRPKPRKGNPHAR